MKNIILIPYAYLSDTSSGKNIKSQNLDIYLRNICVAAISARQNNPKIIDVAVVTNIDLETKYKEILQKYHIQIIKMDFTFFRFANNYLWNLAFYKLNVMYQITHNFDYDSFIYLDADVYVQSSLENVFKETENNILLYDINHGLQTGNYRTFVGETNEFLHNHEYLTHYGGEFFAANKTQGKLFSEKCLIIYQQMIDQNFTTTIGDEFILSIAAQELKQQVKNAGAYVYRYWTGMNRLVSTNYAFNPVAVLHCPIEKNRGLLKLYKKIIKGRKLSNKTVIRKLHLQHPSFKSQVKKFLSH